MNTVNVLLVEDNEGDIVLTTEALNQGKIKSNISVVKDGWEAVLFLEKKEKYTLESTPDIVLLDVNLPKMNGHEVVKYIKTSAAFKQIPVIMFTTSASANDVLQSYANHANCFITKPVDVKEFQAAIASLENFWVSVVQLPNRIK